MSFLSCSYLLLIFINFFFFSVFLIQFMIVVRLLVSEFSLFKWLLFFFFSNFTLSLSFFFRCYCFSFLSVTIFTIDIFLFQLSPSYAFPYLHRILFCHQFCNIYIFFFFLASVHFLSNTCLWFPSYAFRQISCSKHYLIHIRHLIFPHILSIYSRWHTCNSTCDVQGGSLFRVLCPYNPSGSKQFPTILTDKLESTVTNIRESGYS